MPLFRVLVGTHDGSHVSEVVVDGRRDATIGEVSDAVLQRFGSPEGTLRVDGAIVVDRTEAWTTRIHDGTELGVLGPVASGWAPDAARANGLGVAPSLTCVAGPDAGRAFPLATGQHIVGRGLDASVRLADQEVSRRHCELQVEGARACVRDLDSANGTLLGGAAVGSNWVDLGPGRVIHLGTTALEWSAGVPSDGVLLASADGGFVLNRPYRLPELFEPKAVSFPAKPNQAEKRPFPWLMLFLPLIASLVMISFTHRPEFLVMALFGPLGALGTSWQERRRATQKNRIDSEQFDAKTVAAHGAILAEVAREADWLRRRSPSPADILATVSGPGSRLWERRFDDPDFLITRVGVGNRSAAVQLKVQRDEAQQQPAVAAPITVDLRAVSVVGVAGSGDLATRMAEWFTFQIAALHSPDDVRICLLSANASEAEWGFFRWLPHAQLGDQVVAIGKDDRTIAARLAELTTMLDEREAAEGQSFTSSGSCRPEIVVVIEAASELRRNRAVAGLLQRGPRVGIRCICVDRDARFLPEECKAVVIATGGRWVVRSSGSADTSDVAGDPISPIDMERAARRMASIERVSGDAQQANLPRSVRLLDVIDLSEDAAADVEQRWRRTPAQTKAPVGVGAHGNIDIDLAQDGPHGLVAGQTGAGKSEFLRTLVASLAVANTPEDLNFLLMDFKGESSFGDFENLPHTVGTVSNLNADIATRALTSLKAELERRQAQLASARARDFGEYVAARAKNRALPPIARLVIIVDEFAELKDMHPELLGHLVSTARTGRSLGVHLILATQKPHGSVSPEIRANSNLRVCLRVRDTDDSIDVIESPRAARLPSDAKGRTLMSVGGGSLIEFQCASVSLPRPGGGQAPRIIQAGWPTVGYALPEPLVTSGGIGDSALLVEALQEATTRLGIEIGHRPWQPPLPASLLLGELVRRRDVQATRASDPALVPLGLVDEPEKQRQSPFFVSPKLPFAIVGSGGSGRTTALVSLVASLCMKAGPTDCHIHVIDDGSVLALVDELPQVGSVVRSSAAAMVDRLLELLAGEVRRRRDELAHNRWGSIREQRAAGKGHVWPYIWLIADRWDECVPTTMDTARERWLNVLYSDGPAAGLTIAAAGTEAMFRGRTMSHFPQRIVLPLHSPGDAMMVGLRAPATHQPGRALDGDGREVQIARVTASSGALALTRSLRVLAGKIPPAPARQRPWRLRELPGSVSLRQIAKPPSGMFVLGLSGDEAQPLAISVPAMVVAGPRRSGRTTLLRTLGTQFISGGLAIACVGRGLAPLVAAGAIELSENDRPDRIFDAVIVDDAEALPAGAPLTEALVAGANGPLVLGSALEAWMLPSPLLRRALRQESACAVLLCPDSTSCAGSLGFKMDRSRLFDGPPGRALCNVEGDERYLQVATAHV